MKKIRLSISAFLFFCILAVSAQEKGSLGFSFSGLNTNSMLKSYSVENDFTNIKGRGFMSFSLDYWYPISEWMELETGVNYSLQSFTKTLTYSGGVDPIAENYDNHYVNIPVGLRATFLKYGFVNTGVLLDLMQVQGIGSYFGVGAKIESPIGFGMFVNPYIKTHSILPVNFDEKANRLLEAGVRIGVSFKLGNSKGNWR